MWPTKKYGGGMRIRTADPLLAKQMLYQLSYAPVKFLPGINLEHGKLGEK
tara:strand:+ start:563 stop:712 length:150 start_codon:yes stop_codon:yes gene_type:complete